MICAVVSRAAIAAKDSEANEITPARRALLNTIRYAEGTWKQGQEGYRSLYGGGRFSSLERHPEIVVVKRYTSAAAGAYQFLPGTWGEASRKLRLARFDLYFGFGAGSPRIIPGPSTIQPSRGTCQKGW